MLFASTAAALSLVFGLRLFGIGEVMLVAAHMVGASLDRGTHGSAASDRAVRLRNRVPGDHL